MNIGNINSIIFVRKLVHTSIESCISCYELQHLLQYFLNIVDIFFISKSFALNCYIFVVLTNKKTVASIAMKTSRKFSICFCEVNIIFNFCDYCRII